MSAISGTRSGQIGGKAGLQHNGSIWEMHQTMMLSTVNHQIRIPGYSNIATQKPHMGKL